MDTGTVLSESVLILLAIESIQVVYNKDKVKNYAYA